MENKYQKAASLWVANRNKRLNPAKITDVDFDLDPGYQTCFDCNPDDYGSFDTGPSLNISYRYNGIMEFISWPNITAGQFIQECMELLEEEK